MDWSMLLAWPEVASMQASGSFLSESEAKSRWYMISGLEHAEGFPRWEQACVRDRHLGVCGRLVKV